MTQRSTDRRFPLAADRLVIRSSDRVIVGPISFTVGAGDVLALVGESGSGKTSTALALMDDLDPSLQQVGVITSEPRRIGYVPQHPGSVLTPSRRIGSLLREVAKVRCGSPVAPWVERSCRRAGLDPALLRRFPHQLSGGQQQRAVLAMALVGDPVAVIADEPTTGQDPQRRDALAEQLAALAGSGTAILLLSHDLDLVRKLADHTIVLRSGQVIEQGDRVWLEPQQDYTRQLVANASPAPLRQSMQASGPVQLHATAVAAGHRRHRLFAELDLELRSGRCLAIVGPSGAGKSTLARCLAGLHRPYDGSLMIKQTPAPWPAQRRIREHRAGVQYVFQDARAAFDPYRTIAAQVMRPAINLRSSGLDRLDRRLAELTERVGLTTATLHRTLSSLSGGELQRAALLRALLTGPDVLICDEVTTGLDSITRSQVLDLLRSLMGDGLAVIMITHEIQVADRLADDVLHLEPMITSRSPSRSRRRSRHSPDRGR